MIRRLILPNLPELKCTPMKQRIFAAILSLGLFGAAGCEMDKVINYETPAIAGFWKSFEIEEGGLEPFMVNGVLVTLNMRGSGNGPYNAVVVCVSRAEGTRCELVQVHIKGLPTEIQPSIKSELITVNEKIEDQSLYRGSYVLLQTFTVSQLEALAGTKGSFSATLSVRVKQGTTISERQIEYTFARVVRKYLPMR